MSSVEELVKTAQDLIHLLEKASANLKKCPKARLTSGYLQSKIKCVDEYRECFRTAHIKLVKITTKEHSESLPYFKNDWHSQFEELFLECKGDMTDLLENIKSQATQGASQQARVPSDLESSSLLEGKVNLPKMNLPTFSGAYEDWQSFEDIFCSLIHNNASLSDVQKLHYLKSCVSGEAKNAIKNFQVTEKNYCEAWDMLKSRYSHKRLIVDAILKRLFATKKVNTQSASQLKSLIDNTSECLSSLKGLNVSTVSWDPVLVFITVQRLDPETHKDWEKFVSSNYKQELPSFKSLINFLESTVQTLVLITQPTTVRATKERSFHSNSVQIVCDFCSKNHFLYNCKEFSKLIPTKRRDYVRDNRLCFNCLSSGHLGFVCKQKGSCRICGKRHHSLLHCNIREQKGETGSCEVMGNTTGLSSLHTNVEAENDVQQDISITSHLATGYKKALLATALVPVRSISGDVTLLRVLIDPGSEASFISERAVQSLRLKRTAINATVTGVGSATTKVSHMVQLEVLSRYDVEFSLPVRAYVLSSHVTTKLPYKSIMPNEQWSHLEGLNLADPQYHITSKIDMLLGVEVYSQIIKNNLIKGPVGSPTAQETSLGWILFGNVDEENPDADTPSLLVMHHNVDLDNMLKRMWELDSDTDRKLTQEERRCEEIYEETHKRNEEGRYIVNLPFKVENPQSPNGNSKEIAKRRFSQLEKKFQRSPKLREDYTKVIEEYISLGHAEEIPRADYENKAVYLCHHAVFKEDSESTPTRVVFDASCKGTNGISLNDELLVGPTLQEDLRSIVMRWRMHAVCFVSDLKKMYRMVLIAKEHIDYQRILWRKNTNEELKQYRLLTVTFGTAPAPYLAVKTLRQLAEDEGSKFPIAARILKEDFYVDDVLSGFDTVEEAMNAMKELTEILKHGGFELQKWCSNSMEFIKSIDPDKRSTRLQLNLNVDGTIKTLGILWNLANDTFQYNLDLPPVSTITKRNILSDVQKLFDPLGWIAPCIVTAKIIIQKLWLERLDWDQEINERLAQEWINIRKDFENIKNIHVGRWIETTATNKQSMEIHGFCDASEKAYASVVYCRIINFDGTIATKLLAARTRVAPVKSVSLPRLELCGAVLLSRLLKHVLQAMRIPASRVFAWTDSTIVLSWLCGEPSRWKQFVANRVVEILDNVSNTQWYHVRTEHNPADIASRGTLISDLMNCRIWWDGPIWLKQDTIEFKKPIAITTDLEKRIIHANFKTQEERRIKFEDFTNLTELLKVIVFSLRFIRSKIDTNNIDKPITTYELEETLKKCIIIAQEDFTEDIENLKIKKNVRTNSKIKTLNPYLDSDGILRVGGRLRHSALPEQSKHPVILESKNQLTHLLIADAHKRTLHGGIQLVLTYLRSKYWILQAKNTVKAYIHKCIICARQRALVKTQLMGDLPQARTTPARPFLHSGVDFAGPLFVLRSKGRGAKQTKAYIAIFVCMATKAIHLELVGDLTSQSFIGAFRRFVARRGRCSHLYSDQGRNFVGANKELAQSFRDAQLELPGHLADMFASEGTQWHYIPAYSPSFGGLWEAGVRSVKYHLRRILTGSLTFEEMTTTLCEIEACLNSRPLTPIDTTDPDSLEALTPGHLLIGEAPINVPNPDVRCVNINHLDRWKMTQKLVRDFWHRWQTEYLSRLQSRPKWLKKQVEFKIGDIVLLKDEQLPPGKWLLGRIVEKHPGADGYTRVYSIKHGNNVVKRSLSKLCEFPINDADT